MDHLCLHPFTSGASSWFLFLASWPPKIAKVMTSVTSFLTERLEISSAKAQNDWSEIEGHPQSQKLLSFDTHLSV